MRFCPFCRAENNDDLAVCQSCGRRLPPLPPRRARDAPPTGVQLPPRSAAANPPPTPRRTGPTMPPPAHGAGPTSGSPSVPPGTPAGPSTGAPALHPRTTQPFQGQRDSAPALPPPPAQRGDSTVAQPDADRRALLNAITPGPAAQRRDAAPTAERDPTHARRSGEGPTANTSSAIPSRSGSAGASSAIPSPSAIPSLTGTANTPRPQSPSTPPPLARPQSPSTPPPLGHAAPPLGHAAPPLGHAAPPLGHAPSHLGHAPPLGAAAPLGSAPPLATNRAHSPSNPPPLGARSAGSVPPATPPQRPKPPSLPPPGPHAVQLATTPPPAVPTAQPGYPVIPNAAFDDDFNTVVQSADPIHVAAHRVRSPTGVEPPPTRIQRADALVDRPFTPPAVSPVPEIPEPGLVNAAKYAMRFGRARWQRRGAIKTLGAEIKQDTEALDQVLGALGREARNAKVEGRVFSAENGAINAAEERMASLGVEHGEVDARKVEENAKFVDVELERNTKLGEADRLVDEAQKELAQLEGQRRGLRDKRKELERRQKAYLRSAEDKDREAGAQQLGDARQELRRTAESFRKEAAALEPERQDMDRKLAGLERPINEATARLDAAKAELDAAKRSLNDAREGHTHRLAELDAEQKRKSREIALAEGEITRRLVTLGTLVNLNRIEDAAFAELYQRIDRIRGAITARTTEIERLTAEREAYDRGTLVRGISTIGGAILLFIAFMAILRAILT